MRRLTTHEKHGPENALWHWTRQVPWYRVWRNYLVQRLARDFPSLRVKAWLYRRMGVRVGRHVSIGWRAVLDILHPELIEIGDNAIIGYNTTILAHDVTVEAYRTGPVRIGKNATIGANCTVLAGSTIADGAVVAAHSLVNGDVEGFVGGVPAKPLGGRGPASAPRI